MVRWTSIGAVALCALAGTACISGGGGGGGGGGSGTGAGGTDTGGTSAGTDASSGGTTDTATGGGTGTSDTGSGTGSKDSGGGTTTPKCMGDFALMSTPFSSGDSKQVGAKCDGTVPKNCPKGESIKFNDTGECICIIGCDKFAQPIPVGGNCNNDGSWKCLEIVSTNGSNKMKACVNVSWGLCHTGSSGGTTGTDAGSSSGDTATPPKDTSGPTCKQAGTSCEVNSECCSKQCDPDFGDCQ